jgi:hypothetical protein
MGDWLFDKVGVLLFFSFKFKSSKDLFVHPLCMQVVYYHWVWVKIEMFL